MSVFFVLAIIVFSYWISMFFIHLVGLPKIPSVPLVERQQGEEPLVSVIVAGKEEEAAIASTLRGLLRQAYSRFEVIAVNDRSEDATGERMEAVKRWAQENGLGHVPFQVVHVERLPEGWLGKNHALYEGYRRAKGEILLFTDADIAFRPHTIRSTVRFLQENKVDHLTLAPFLLAKSLVLRGFVQFFLFSLGMLKWMWRPNNDKQTKLGMGIGAFNMITRKAYEKIGTHRAIAMRPDDDLMLGQRVKQAGLRQRLATGQQFLCVEWYPSLRAAMQGLEKNIFAGLEYKLWLVAAGLLGQLVFYFLPFVGTFVFDGWTQGLFGAAALLLLSLNLIYVQKMTNYSGWEVLLLPFTVLLFCYILIRSTFLTLKRGGIYWRGTFYSLAELKKRTSP